ncbi:YbaB/EbfC family nucleoid-associated protein [Nonomuraea sp. NBC_01738]|uniref:YbaB/EbfC family nucleoid-associated protein n=1 Tax=Nonomuraea sp. NBC_01738 TaxID=2976003 RepID=UPI002E0D1114|nr:YbaB/EbfC family nucleoid-associated protein [Nonomuraea sp. NBC_01738]
MTRPDLGDEGDLERLSHEIERIADAFSGGMRELEEQTVTGADATGQVVATVSGSSHLLKLRIDPRAMRDLDHVELAQAALAAVTAARTAAAEGLDEIMGALNGGLAPADPQDNPLARAFDSLFRDGKHG